MQMHSKSALQISFCTDVVETLTDAHRETARMKLKSIASTAVFQHVVSVRCSLA